MAHRIRIKIGARGSPLALVQAEAVRRALAQSHSVPMHEFEICAIRTTGDRIVDRSLAEAGGKGLFTKELDAALLAGEIDCAVHSAKDLPTILPEGVAIAGYQAREDPRDVFVSARAARLADLPRGATLGSASPRRQAQAKRLRPDLKLVLLRGNVETRLRRVESGEIDATLLALAGLKRLGLEARATQLLSSDEFLPAVGQGAVAIAVRADDHATRVALGSILDAATGYALTAERAFLAVLDGSCRTPIAGLATSSVDRLAFRGMVFRIDGSQHWEITDSAPLDDAEELGRRSGRALMARLPAGLFAS